MVLTNLNICIRIFEYERVNRKFLQMPRTKLSFCHRISVASS